MLCSQSSNASPGDSLTLALLCRLSRSDCDVRSLPRTIRPADDHSADHLQHPGWIHRCLKDGRIQLARAYGFANQQNQTPVQPDSRHRVASPPSSIPPSRSCIWWCKKGYLRPAALAQLPDLPPACAIVDFRKMTITIRKLITRTSGWDDSVTPDLMFYSSQIRRGVSLSRSRVHRERQFAI